MADRVIFAALPLVGTLACTISPSPPVLLNVNAGESRHAPTQMRQPYKAFHAHPDTPAPPARRLVCNMGAMIVQRALSDWPRKTRCLRHVGHQLLGDPTGDDEWLIADRGDLETMTTEVNEQMLAAYNEAGHGFIGVLQGRKILSMQIYANEDMSGKWGGRTDNDPSLRDRDLTLPPEYIYERLGIPKPQPYSSFMVWERCTFCFAGVVAEKLLCEQEGVDYTTVRIAEQDVYDARNYANLLDQEQAQEALTNSEAWAWKILRDPDCWRSLEALATQLIEKHRLTEDEILSTVLQAFSAG